MSNKKITEIEASNVPFAHGLTLQKVHHIMMALRLLAQSMGGPAQMRKDLGDWADSLEKAIGRAVRKHVEDNFGASGGPGSEIYACASDELAAVRERIEKELDEEEESASAAAGKRPDNSKPRQDN